MTARRITNYKDNRLDAFLFIADLCTTPNRHDTIVSRPGSKASAFAFRQRIYMWRRSVLSLLAEPESKAAIDCLEYLQGAMGRRFNKDWLDYTRFDITNEYSKEDDSLLYRVKGSVSIPMYGPDLIFADDPAQLAAIDEAQALIRAATANRSASRLLDRLRPPTDTAEEC